MLHPLDVECRDIATKLGHSTITSLHVLAAWLHMPEAPEFPGRAVAQLNVAKMLGWKGFSQEPAPDGSLHFNDSARSWLSIALDNVSSYEALSALISELGVNTHQVVGEEATTQDVAGDSSATRDQAPGKRVPMFRGSSRVGQAPTEPQTPVPPPEHVSSSPTSEALAALHNLVGLRSVKDRVAALVHQQEFNVALRKRNRKSPTAGVNLIFTGNPGTGKTTVARLISEIYRDLGLLTKGHLVEVTQSDLISPHVGETALKTSAQIGKALGGTLFIDEAYSLADGHSFGQEALATLVAQMEDKRDDLAVIVAGYPEPMEAFFRANAGLKSRFVGTIHFDDYTTSELLHIFLSLAQEYSLSVSDDVVAAVERHLTSHRHEASSGNGRYVRNLFLRTWEQMTLRVAQDHTLGPEDVEAFEVSDVPNHLQINHAPVSIEEVLADLDALVGLEPVKAKIRTLVNRVRANEKLVKDGKPTVKVSLNLVFSGPPGTGKTTVAREVARAYRAMGVLSRGHLVEVGRTDLVSSYLGDTARKTQEKIDQAMGGILFIDEAYSLLSGHSSDYGQEAIATLVAEMENRRGDLAVIVAGYEDDMKAFLGSNAGLRSRFDDELLFTALTDEELVHVFATIAQDAGISVSNDTAEAISRHLRSNREAVRNGNARYVRKLFDRAYDSLVNRAARVGFADDSLSTMLSEDIPDRLEEPLSKRIGFGQ